MKSASPEISVTDSLFSFVLHEELCQYHVMLCDVKTKDSCTTLISVCQQISGSNFIPKSKTAMSITSYMHSNQFSE